MQREVHLTLELNFVVIQIVSVPVELNFLDISHHEYPCVSSLWGPQCMTPLTLYVKVFWRSCDSSGPLFRTHNTLSKWDPSAEAAASADRVLESVTESTHVQPNTASEHVRKREDPACLHVATYWDGRHLRPSNIILLFVSRASTSRSIVCDSSRHVETLVSDFC